MFPLVKRCLLPRGFLLVRRGCRDIGMLLPNNQRQHRTLHIQKDVLPYALCTERECFIDNLLVLIRCISVMIRWAGLAPWEFEFPFPGSLTSTLQTHWGVRGPKDRQPVSGHRPASTSTGVPRS